MCTTYVKAAEMNPLNNIFENKWTNLISKFSRYNHDHWLGALGQTHSVEAISTKRLNVIKLS